MQRITGTFIDVINNEILSSNWGHKEWACDFDAMREIGIDTVILIRAGIGDKMVFDSRVLKENFRMRPAYLDMVDILLTECERCEMNFFFGGYDGTNGGDEDDRGASRKSNPKDELAVNIALCDEFMDKYGHRRAFKGWYLAHEACAYSAALAELYNRLGAHMKKLKNLPTLISPLMLKTCGVREDDPRYVELTRKGCVHWFDLEVYEKYWDLMFKEIHEAVDIVAFQDGYVPFVELPDFLAIDQRLIKKYGMRSWSNVESFERNTPLNFLPIDWRNLRYKMEAAEKAGYEKLITFEFSHFMSPNSMGPSARNLYRRYREWLDEPHRLGS